MNGRIAALARHPVKGFTPEAVASAQLTAGGPFPHDRLYALEAGPSGFDARAPAHVSKMKLAVLAPLPVLARVTTAYDARHDALRASAPGAPAYAGVLANEDDRAAFANWVQAFLATAAPDVRRGPLKMLAASGHRFYDDVAGAVSVLNLASVRDLAEQMGETLEPARFRANVLVEGWPAWIEQSLPVGATLRLGESRLTVVKPIRRCVAVHVHPTRGVRDLDVSAALFARRGNVDCGVYLQVAAPGGVAVGDIAELAPA